MKKMKKAAALIMCLLLVFSLCACSSFQSKVIKGAKQMQELRSFHADVNADIDMSMDILSQKLKLDMTVNSSSDIQTEPFRMYSEIESEMMGMGGKSYSFMEKSGEDFYLYSSTDNEHWEREELEAGEGPADLDVLAVIGLLAKYASSFEEAGEETVEGFETVRYDGIISEENIGELIELLGGAEFLEKAVDKSVDMEQSLENLEGEFSIPTSMWLEKDSGMIIKYEMDVTEMAALILSEAMDDIIMEMGPELPDVGLKLSIEKTVIQVILSEFDKLGELEVPTAA